MRLRKSRHGNPQGEGTYAITMADIIATEVMHRSANDKSNTSVTRWRLILTSYHR